MTSFERKVINFQIFISADGMTAGLCMPIFIVIINSLNMRRDANVVTI